ncbi:Fe-S cluster assembly protein SufD [Tessaracoccus sp. MC1679]|uniref:Fe-S cluster assembly protein SufD n=1 Tax=unclassified Tessaracoccus TaxID=2635419 RepID=UPI0016039B9A|nr:MULTISPECIES: Fe-S cluster assembly protein SufD [unclassified Tessaracoccus]MBB1513098.1 Fe-S cluster assembly protein SufD [Tessaracoccus sp. MC1627]MBB1515781.1 Fe-S cluster assembly protein SufD [Tessaracoccus sp. MC1679]
MPTLDGAANVAGAIETIESHLHPEPSFDVAKHPMPTGREEIWRFSPLKALRPLLAEGDALGGLDWAGEVPDGVEMRAIPAAEARERAIEPPVDRIAAIAAQRTGEAVYLNVPAEAVIAEPIVFTATGSGGPAAESFIADFGRHSRATLVLHFEGSAQYAAKYDFRVADGAEINLVYVNDWAEDTVHGAQISVQVGRDAHVRTIHTSLGGKAIRIAERASFAGPGGSVEQFGLYFVNGGQHVEHRMFVDHNEPHTKSNVDYRGALQGKGAHSVWIGDVLIRKVAKQIETYESNKNLVLTDGCQADSVPNLEIETGEIAGAGHSSTTGRFDDNQLFYLMSRGITEDEARRLIVHGFFNDIIRRIGVPAIEQRLLAQVERELELVHGSTATKEHE